MSNELQARAEPSVLSVIEAAVEKGFDANQLKVLFDLQCRHYADLAAKAYAEAMNKCQAEMPTVVKDKENSSIGGKKYAPLETIKTYTKPTYTKYGFSLVFTAEPGTIEGRTTVHLDVTHTGGHTRRTTLPNVPMDDKGPKGGDVKTQIQGLMSSMSYAQGRLICLAFNITVADEDRDGNPNYNPRYARVSLEQMAALDDLIVDTKSNRQKFLEFASEMAKAELVALDEIPERLFEALIRTLKQKKARAT